MDMDPEQTMRCLHGWQERNWGYKEKEEKGERGKKREGKEM